jgi:glycosyltransferase involved in cell wall biosynthesis
MSEVRASVLIPTYDHATTLPLTVASVLRQSVADLEVLVIGDGVTAANRAVIDDLVTRDPRVRFLDFPKGPHHGEIYRHEAILAARGEAILYLCDDDLVLPEHVADLLALLETADFAQSRNGYVTPEGRVGLYPADLADRACVDWHLELPRRNMTSITGSAHTRAYYLEVGDHWETTPPGEWPDHYQWKKFFRRPDFRGATSRRMTALQFPTHLDGRESWTPQRRHDELAHWADVVAEPDAQQRIDRMVDRATQLALAHAVLDTDRVRADLDDARAVIADRDTYVHELHLRLTEQHELIERLRTRVRRRGRKLERAQADLDALRAELDATRRSSSWRITAPLRRLRDLGRSGRARDR